jgi:hypothetical protein
MNRLEVRYIGGDRVTNRKSASLYIIWTEEGDVRYSFDCMGGGGCFSLDDQAAAMDIVRYVHRHRGPEVVPKLFAAINAVGIRNAGPDYTEVMMHESDCWGRLAKYLNANPE